MRSIDISRFLAKHNLKRRDIAKLLFPKNRQPVDALRRIESGTALLDSAQIARLALAADVTIDELYGTNWKPIKTDKGVLSFEREKYMGQLYSDAPMIARLFVKGELIQTKIIASNHIELSEFFNLLDDLVIKYESNE